MKHRLTAYILSLILVLSVAIAAMPTFAAEPVNLYVTANKTKAAPGAEVKFTVDIGPVNNMGGLEFVLSIPDGLTVVDASITVPDGVAEALDADGAIVIPNPTNGYKFSYSAQDTGYTSTKKMTLLKFTCTVDEDATQKQTVSIDVEDIFDNSLALADLEYHVIDASISIAAETAPPETKAPETKAPETKAPETKAPETKAPETKAPETKAPETKAPETKAPETKAPETKAPETIAPDTTVSETTAPDTTVDTSAPESEPMGTDASTDQADTNDAESEPIDSSMTESGTDTAPQTDPAEEKKPGGNHIILIDLVLGGAIIASLLFIFIFKKRKPESPDAAAND